jgi:hypothetical protein
MIFMCMVGTPGLEPPRSAKSTPKDGQCMTEFGQQVRVVLLY